jgi:hypothetical protein
MMRSCPSPVKSMKVMNDNFCYFYISKVKGNLSNVNVHCILSNISSGLDGWHLILLNSTNRTVCMSIPGQIYCDLCTFNWRPRYNWYIVQSGVKHHNPNPLTIVLIVVLRFVASDLHCDIFHYFLGPVYRISTLSSRRSK